MSSIESKGPCRYCCEYKPLYTMRRLCDGCYSLLRARAIVALEDGGFKRLNDMTVEEARRVIRAPRGERANAAPRPRGFTPDREFFNFGITAAGESLGLGHYTDDY